MKRLDPEKKRICLFIVDGASNVQLAGQVVEAVFPMVTVLHGSEHLLSLFFSDIAKIPAIHVSTNNDKLILHNYYPLLIIVLVYITEINCENKGILSCIWIGGPSWTPCSIHHRDQTC